MTTMTAGFPIADYAAMSREQLRELVGGFTVQEFVFVLHQAHRKLPRCPKLMADPQEYAPLLDAAVDGFLSLGIAQLRNLLAADAGFRAAAGAASRRDDEREFWRQLAKAQAVTGGSWRTDRLAHLARNLVHLRQRREGGCGDACCDPMWWTRRGLPHLDRRRKSGLVTAAESGARAGA